jgi:hypothetical protein
MSNLKYAPNETVIFLERQGYCGQIVVHYCSGEVANRYEKLSDIPESCGGIFYRTNISQSGESLCG